MRAVWRRLSGQKSPMGQTKGLLDSHGKVRLDTQNKLRIDDEYLQKTSSKNETPEERAIIPEEIWRIQEENAKNT